MLGASPGLGSLSNSMTFLQVTAHLAAYLSPSVSFLSSTCKAEKDSLTIYYLTQDPQLHSRGPQHKWRKLQTLLWSQVIKSAGGKN